MLKKVIIACALALLLAPAAIACSDNQAPIGENEVPFEYSIPLIDIDALAVTETATFAMG